MGVTISSNNHSEDMGYGGFLRFRKKVAALANKTFGAHYETIDGGSFLFDDARTAFYEQYDAKTEELVKANAITPEISNFCHQSDCEGSIDQRQAQQIYTIIKDYDDNMAYGYVGRPDCATFARLKALMQDCAENGGIIEWC